MKEVKDLIRYFCSPCKTTKVNGEEPENFGGTRQMGNFQHNKRDVHVELQTKTRFPVPYFVWDEYHLDQEINDRGIHVSIWL